MTSEYIEQRNGGYSVAGTRISLDSVVYSFKRGNSPEGIREEFPLLELWQIYGALAFYLAHETAIEQYLDEKEQEIDACSVPMSRENPELWERIQRARESMSERKS
jgi:uncharacterized protein (DUF433 family)